MHRNEVMLVGRLSMEPVGRELPSGSLLTQWRLAVRRPDDHPGRQRSDAIECATFDDEVRDMVTGWLVDDVIEVQGALRRRWWRGGSRYEVEVRTARRVAHAPDGSADPEDQVDQDKRAESEEAQAARRSRKGSRRRPVISLRRSRPAPDTSPGARGAGTAADPENGRGTSIDDAAR
jgi:single-stranded DNA-binding protein